MFRTSASLPLRVAQRASWQQVPNDFRQRGISYSQSLYATPGSSSSKAPSSSGSSVPSSPSRSPGEKTSDLDSPSAQHSPTTIAVVKGLAWLMGYKSKTSTAIRETRDSYSKCAVRDVEEANFIHNQCRLSPTYQTWFQITNMHVWLIRTRYRSLPATHGKIYDQELVNHFFLDVEDRMRTALAHKAPERIVKGYMKEMRDQWTGATFSFDLGLVGSDAELSGAVWRNIFASRGLDGKGEVIGKPGKPAEPRAVEDEPSAAPTVDIPGVDLETSSRTATLSDSALAELPFHLYVFTAYMRRELRRLESLPDEEVIRGDIGSFGSFESHVLAAERDFAMETEERKLLGLDEDIPSTASIPKVKKRAARA